MKNEKEIYYLLNEIRVDASEYEDFEVSFFEKEKYFRNVTSRIKPNKRKQPLHLVLVMIMFFFALAAFPPVQAAIQTFLGEIRYSLSEALGGNDATNDAVVSVQQIDKIGNTDVKVEDLIYLEDRLIINLLVNMEGTADELAFLGFGNVVVTLDGEQISTHSIGKGSIFDKENNIYSSIIDINLSKPLNPEQELTIGIEAQDILYNDYSENSKESPIKETAFFTIQTSVTQLIQYVKEYPINIPIEYKEGTITIERLITHPIITLLEFSYDNPDDTFQLIEIKGTDENGRHVLFQPYDTTHSPEGWFLTHQFLESDSELSAQELYEAEKITLQLYSAGHPEGEQATFKPYGEPFEINLKMHLPE
ncbi:hypothetical protein [Jeotgalibaca sp. A127]|uniref:hypothetical protein n=1 Tax=Jeotgalibaca sp. A127 TaxID=3457324 RepID=UPI003FD48369